MWPMELFPQKGPSSVSANKTSAKSGDIQTQLIHLAPDGEKTSLRTTLQREENSPYDASSPMSTSKHTFEYSVGYAIM